MLHEAIDTVVEGMNHMAADIVKHFDKRFERIEGDITFIKRDIRDIKADTPTRSDFDKLERRVGKLESAILPQ